MAPLIFVATLLTHLVGGSAGREGTAVQMGAVIADQFYPWSKHLKLHRDVFILAGVAAGFASLFGTPWAGAIFAVEIFRNKTVRWVALFPALLTSFTAYYTCHWTGASHMAYPNIHVPHFSWSMLALIVFCGALFGLTARGFIKLQILMEYFSEKICKSQLWRPFFGGIVLLVVYYFVNSSRYMGLGIPVILESFDRQVLPYDFIAKLFLTVITLGFGFKGGEVTPLFFIGATLGNTISLFIPLPFSFLSALGFIAVFSGSTNTFLACAIMGIELFGFEAAPYFLVVTLVSQLFSGRKSIYKDQPSNKFSIYR